MLQKLLVPIGVTILLGFCSLLAGPPFFLYKLFGGTYYFGCGANLDPGGMYSAFNKTIQDVKTANPGKFTSTRTVGYGYIGSATRSDILYGPFDYDFAVFHGHGNCIDESIYLTCTDHVHFSEMRYPSTDVGGYTKWLWAASCSWFYVGYPGQDPNSNFRSCMPNRLNHIYNTYFPRGMTLTTSSDNNFKIMTSRGNNDKCKIHVDKGYYWTTLNSNCITINYASPRSITAKIGTLSLYFGPPEDWEDNVYRYTSGTLIAQVPLYGTTNAFVNKKFSVDLSKLKYENIRADAIYIVLNKSTDLLTINNLDLKFDIDFWPDANNHFMEKVNLFKPVFRGLHSIFGHENLTIQGDDHYKFDNFFRNWVVQGKSIGDAYLSVNVDYELYMEKSSDAFAFAFNNSADPWKFYNEKWDTASNTQAPKGECIIVWQIYEVEPYGTTWRSSK
jgi:hypothetical protein